MWQLLFWGSVALVAYTYAGYPVLLYLLGLVRRRRAPDGASDAPSACLIISAFDEESVIRAKIENSISLDYPRDRLTIIVASDGSTDGTTAVASSYEDMGVRLHHNPRRRGKSALLNEVVAGLNCDIVAFTDANSLFAVDALKRLCRHFGDADVGCVVGRLRYVQGGETSVGKGEGIYWRYEALISRLESRLGSVLVANGSIFAIRRRLFRPLYAEVANDFQIPFDIAAQGKRVVYEPRAVATEPTTVYWREEFGRKVRIVLRGLTGWSLMRKRIRGFRRFQFWSHKNLRWMVGAAAVVAFVSSAVPAARGSTLYAALLGAQVAFYAAAMVGLLTRRARRPRRAFYVPFYFTMVNAAALTAIARFLSGERLTVWEKAESTRLVTQPSVSGSRGEATEAVAAGVDDGATRAAKR
jgi:cellulose synthase/poly-beta-1,6-N-acetylglucosamine synthase-like glycosyltransferase